MEYLDIYERGQLFKRRRLQLGLRLEDLADEKISPSTISKIERGVPSVGSEYVDYLATKIGLNDDQKLESLQTEEEEKEGKIELQLLAAESLLDHVGAGPALDKLKTINIKSNDPHYPKYLFLKGKCYSFKGNQEKARNLLHEAIRISDLYPEYNHLNNKALALCGLALVSYHQNDCEQSIAYTITGLEAFVENGEDKVIKDILLINQAICLEKLDRNEESYGIAIKLWERRKEIESMNVILQLHELFGLIFKKNKMYSRAIQYTREGIRLARINKFHARAFDMWTLLGKIFIEKEEYDEAENCLSTALEMKDKGIPPYLHIETYTDFGRLYIQLQEWALAKEQLENALKIGEKLNDALRYLKALRTTGELHFKQDDIETAISYFEKALGLAKKHTFRAEEKEILGYLADCWKSKDKEKYYGYLERKHDVEKLLKKGD